ncbi:Protein CBG26095 [Caenorhabditis briggsae]|uniref:Protein CBG26095 n=1 Tax=Caenorhabditis briggsae TaxID=6238 RepID=B6IJK5_CAEBR|nr:Protein CBG26095 [Caenorhabditis briggsae]CAS00085.1 Protein CBG26095 [Caenorhabditis briggsae]
MKRPSGELSSDVAIRSPLRERKNKPQNNIYAKFAQPQTPPRTPPKAASPKAQPPPPPVFSPKKAVSPPVSPKAHRHHHDKEKNNHRHHRQKEEEYPESSKDDSNRDDKIKSPTKSPAVAQSPSGSDAENQKDPEKTWSPIVCFIRLSYYIVFLSFFIVLIFWLMATATSLHYVDIEFMEKKFMEN